MSCIYNTACNFFHLFICSSALSWSQLCKNNWFLKGWPWTPLQGSKDAQRDPKIPKTNFPILPGLTTQICGFSHHPYRTSGCRTFHFPQELQPHLAFGNVYKEEISSVACTEVAMAEKAHPHCPVLKHVFPTANSDSPNQRALRMVEFSHSPPPTPPPLPSKPPGIPWNLFFYNLLQ